MIKKKDSLQSYRKKRNFEKTPEPSGKKKTSGKKSLFVIQEHAASHHHFDFRIEIDHVLASWAIPKEITTDPAKKFLAIPTEDHPMDYAHFEGIIPKGQYGGGTVMVWDIGTYKNLKDMSMQGCYKKGRIEIFLEGKKLKGGYALIRTRRKDGDNYWLFIKMRDEYANRRIVAPTKSALTSRTMKQIAKEG